MGNDSGCDVLGNLFADTGDPYYATTSIFLSHANEQPLHKDVSAWLVEAFKQYIENGVPLERSLGFVSAKGQTSPAKKSRIEEQWRQYMLELARLQIALNISPESAAGMVEARLEIEAGKGKIKSSETHTDLVLLKKWYSEENEYRISKAMRESLQGSPDIGQLDVDIGQYPEHARPVN